MLRAKVITENATMVEFLAEKGIQGDVIQNPTENDIVGELIVLMGKLPIQLAVLAKSLLVPQFQDLPDGRAATLDELRENFQEILVYKIHSPGPLNFEVHFLGPLGDVKELILT